ncbi:hypothetical protein ISCGN_031993 [Ixodes scapularis]
MEVLWTKKGKDALYLDGYKYVSHRHNKNGTTVWSCQKYRAVNCSVTVLTEGECPSEYRYVLVHPNVGVAIISGISKLFTSRLPLLQLSNGGQARKRLKRWNDKEESIKDLEERLPDGALNLDGFL